MNKSLREKNKVQSVQEDLYNQSLSQKMLEKNNHLLKFHIGAMYYYSSH